MKDRYLFFVLFILLQIPAFAQTKEEWKTCRDSVYVYVRKVAMAAAGDHSVALSLFDIYLTAQQYNKIQEVKEITEKSPEVIKAKQLCDSMLNVVEKSYNDIPAIYVIKEELCKRVNELRVAAVCFHNVVWKLYFTDVYAKEVDTRYSDIEKQMDELIAKYSELFKEISE